MKRLKKLLCFILCLSMLTGITSVPASAASAIVIFNVTVAEPKVGEKPSTTGSVPSTASTTVTKVEWIGALAADGTFAAGQAYTVQATCTIKPGQDKIVKFVDGSAKINGNKAALVSVSSDQKSITLQYTYDKAKAVSSSDSTDILTTAYDDLSLHDYEWEVLRLTNVERAKAGLDTLSMPQALQLACDVRAEELATLYSHTRPNGSDWNTAIGVVFKCTVCGENIGKGQQSPEVIVDAWMNSTGHRANILNEEYGYLGVGYYSGMNGWVQLFGSRERIIKVEASTQKTEFTETEILDHYLKLTTSDGYVSYLPLDFNSMKENADGTYSPRISFFALPSYTKVEEDSSEDTSINAAEKVKLLEDAQIAENAVKNYTDKNSFTQNGLLNVARAAVKNGTIVEWAEYNETPATTSKEGLISGVFSLTLGESSMKVSISKTIPKLPDTGSSDSIFERFVPIEHVYGAFLGDQIWLESGEYYRFNMGTQLSNQNDEYPHDHHIKRCLYQGGYVKVNYLGTYGTVDEEVRNIYLGLLSSADSETVLAGGETDWSKAYGITRDTVVISVDLYDANQKFVQNISPACVILLTSEEGDFLTYSRMNYNTCSLYFSHQTNIFSADADERMEKLSIYFQIDKVMVDDKDVASALLPLQTEPQEEYVFIQYPALTGEKIYNANRFLTDKEFITPDNTYYQILRDSKGVDPVVNVKIENVVSYSEHQYKTEDYLFARNIVDSKGTLYAVKENGEIKVIAENIKKTGLKHYLTKNGVVKDMNGKVVAKKCVDFAESRDCRVIGVLKKNKSLLLGYTYLAGGEGYEAGLKKVLKKVTQVVAGGAYTKDNTFYRWRETVTTKGEIDMDAFYNGYVNIEYDCKLDVQKLCTNAQRVFPNEYLTKIWGDQASRDETITGFVQSGAGELIGFGLRHQQSFGYYDSMVERIFPMYESAMDGNFVGFKLEGSGTVYGIAARYCDYNQYRVGKIGMEYGNGERYYPEFLSETLDGFLAADNKVYSINATPSIVISSLITPVGNERANFGQMHRTTQTYRAYNSSTDESIPLLPSIASWCFDEGMIVLLERTDGSVWASSNLPKVTYADLSAKVGGYENSNVVQITGAQTKKISPEYVTLKQSKKKK